MAESIKIKLPASSWGMTEDNAQFKANKHQKTLDILILEKLYMSKIHQNENPKHSYHSITQVKIRFIIERYMKE